MSLTSFIGPKPNLLGIDDTDPMLRREGQHPVVSGGNLAKLVNIDILEFYKADEIFKQAKPACRELKRELEKALAPVASRN